MSLYASPVVGLFIKILLPLLVIGCGRAVEPGDTVCYADGVTIHLEFKADCAKVARNIALAKRMGVEARILNTDPTNFETVYGGSAVTIKATPDLGCLEKNSFGVCHLWLLGTYETNNTITTDCTMRAFLHEMGHRIEQLSFGYCTKHQDWVKWGWMPYTDGAYADQSENTCYLD